MECGAEAVQGVRNVRDKEGLTALSNAAKFGQAQIIDLIGESRVGSPRRPQSVVHAARSRSLAPSRAAPARPSSALPRLTEFERPSTRRPPASRRP